MNTIEKIKTLSNWVSISYNSKQGFENIIRSYVRSKMGVDDQALVILDNKKISTYIYLPTNQIKNWNGVTLMI